MRKFVNKLVQKNDGLKFKDKHEREIVITLCKHVGNYPLVIHIENGSNLTPFRPQTILHNKVRTVKAKLTRFLLRVSNKQTISNIIAEQQIKNVQ